MIPLTEKGVVQREQWEPWLSYRPKVKPPAPAKILLERLLQYVYVMKLSDNSFYVGKTPSLNVRFREHKDDQVMSTKGKDPRPVYFEAVPGGHEEVHKREGELTLLNQTAIGRRRLREMVEDFRAPLRLLDLDA